MRLPCVLFACLVLLLPLVGESAPAQTTIVLVRHAEKASDDTRDPRLSALGWQRAIALAERLATTQLAAIYATPYQRTQLTAAATAQGKGLPVTLRAASEPASEFADMLRRRHRGESVLVVGHSNTIPALVEALGAQAVPPIAEHEYDRLFVVTLHGSQGAELRVETLGGTALRD
jgi:broad specificity phosphatase PhoE